MIKEYDKVKLRTGQNARIVEVLEPEKMYIGEIIGADRHVEIDHISFDDIVSVYVENEVPIKKYASA
jgi:hypothetical protein